jgi:hypothetical protein
MSQNKPHDVFKHINIPLDPITEQRLPAFDDDGKPVNCWMWESTIYGADLRPAFTLYGKRRTAYRIVYELVHGEAIPEGLVVRHKCDNSLCCRPEHLVVGTRKQNMRDMVERDRHHGAGLEVVHKARALMEQGWTDAMVGNEFGLSQRWANDIRNMRRYGMIPWEWGENWLLFHKSIDIKLIRDKGAMDEYRRTAGHLVKKLQRELDNRE